MKTRVADFISLGISNLADLQAALQLAMQLEFSTIPPYLCAEWSIDSDNDPDNVIDIIHTVVMQEMFHFASAGNLLSAIGGTPQIATSAFIPSYPATELPGGIAQSLPVDLQPLSKRQLQVFMQIEEPEFPPIAMLAKDSPPPTIGAFYDTISNAFMALKPAINGASHAVIMASAKRIASVDDALTTIATIKQEGEGTPQSPDEPATDNGQLAHYYLFKEVFLGNRLMQTDGSWKFNGAPITMPNVLPFSASIGTPDPSLAFNQTLAVLLRDLESCWTHGQAFSRNNMDNLAQLGMSLIQAGIRPTFLWPPE